jgi:hypothetical protein
VADCVGVEVTVLVDVCVGVWVGVLVAVGVGVDVRVAVPVLVAVGVEVSMPIGVFVGVAVFVGDTVAVRVGGVGGLGPIPVSTATISGSVWSLSTKA